MFLRPMSCPHCGAPIAEEMIGRSIVTCGYCRGTFGPEAGAVYRIAFARALREAEDAAPAPGIVLRGRRFVPELELARTPRALTLLARTWVPAVERVVLKLAKSAEHVEREREVLAALASSTAAGHTHFATRVPQLVAAGVADVEGTHTPALAVRARAGYLHNANDVLAAYASGLDGRHLVWIWRRILEVLGFVHESGWAHRAIELDHLVVSARDHGVLLVGFGAATRADAATVVADVVASAAAVRSLAGVTPMPDALAEVVRAASSGEHANARTLGETVARAARAAYGPPAFHPLTLPPFRR